MFAERKERILSTLCRMLISRAEPKAVGMYVSAPGLIPAGIG